MSFHFKYKPVLLKNGSRIYRPMIPIIIYGKEIINALAILDSGSDMTILPKEIAQVLDIEYQRENEVSGISGIPLKAKEGKINVSFGKGRENYNFEIPVLVPLDRENLSLIIGRCGFFTKFKITFDEANRKIEFKKTEDFKEMQKVI